VIVAAVRVGGTPPAARGEGYFSPPVAAKIAGWARGETSELDELTERELDVLRLLAQGRPVGISTISSKEGLDAQDQVFSQYSHC